MRSALPHLVGGVRGPERQPPAALEEHQRHRGERAVHVPVGCQSPHTGTPQLPLVQHVRLSTFAR